MPLVITTLAILLLLVLVMKFRVHAFLALAIITFLLALALQVPLPDMVEAIEEGLGGTLATTGLIFGFGAILGKLLADAGGAQRISVTLVNRFGQRWVQWAVVAASLILGIALFFEVGIVLLVPIVYQMAKQAQVNLLYLGVPMVAGLSVMHAFLPPSPGPTVIAGQYGADLGMVLLYGFVIALPTAVIAGPVFTYFARKYVPSAFNKTQFGSLATLGEGKQLKLEETPSFASSAFTALFPVLLMFISSAATIIRDTMGLPGNPAFDVLDVLGQPTAVMMLSVLLAIYTMGIARRIPMRQMAESAETAVKAVGMILLILGISGSLTEILLVGGVGDYVEDMFQDSTISPLLLAWLIAAIIRLAQGSATVAALTATGLVIPLIEGSDVNLALVTLATGAGSIIASHVNDTGFWIVKESFGLTVKETLATWTVLEIIISVCGFGFIMLLSLVV